jgi:hypothetical protein
MELLAPDVYVNASIALGSAPEKVAQKFLGDRKRPSRTTEWILATVQSMLSKLPEFKPERVDSQMTLIRSLVEVVDDADEYAGDAWEEALIAAAKTVAADRVITDHPDLLSKERTAGIEFISTEAWLIEASMPPPPPPRR